MKNEGLKDGWEDIEKVLHREGLPYLPEIIRIKVISRHHDDPLAGHFGFEKTRELVARKYLARCRGLRQGLRCLSSIQGSPPQDLRRPAVATSAYALLEKLLDGFRH